MLSEYKTFPKYRAADIDEYFIKKTYLQTLKRISRHFSSPHSPQRNTVSFCPKLVADRRSTSVNLIVEKPF